MGKSTAAAYFARAGIRVHDADKAVHDLYKPNGRAAHRVLTAFPTARAPDGGVDRSALSDALMRNDRADALKTLESIVHPLVTQQRAEFVAAAARDGEWLVVVDVPLLFETMPDEAARRAEVDVVVVVSAGADEQRRRALARAGWSEEKLDAILARQLPDAEKRARADFVIETGGEGHAAARAQLAAVLEALRRSHADRWAAWIRSPPGGGGGGGPTALRCVTLDLDETCWPTMPPVLSAVASLEAHLETALPRAAAAGATSREAQRALLDSLREAEPHLAHDMTALRRAALRRIAEAHGDELSDAALDAAMDVFLDARSRTSPHLFDDLRPAIAALRAAGLAVGAVTDGNADVRRDAELSELFDFSVTAADAGATKSAAAPFLIAAAAARCHVSEMVHIGDSVRYDLNGALACGVRAVLLSRASAPPRSAEDEAARPRRDDRWREVSSLAEASALVTGVW